MAFQVLSSFFSVDSFQCDFIVSDKDHGLCRGNVPKLLIKSGELSEKFCFCNVNMFC